MFLFSPQNKQTQDVFSNASLSKIIINETKYSKGDQITFVIIN